MVKRYDSMGFESEYGIWVRGVDFDVQVDAGMKLYEENEQLRARYKELLTKAVGGIALERIAQLEAALTWVLANFNTFEQPPEHLKSIVDDACLKAMTADEDAVRMTAEARRSAPETACDCAGPVGPAGQHEPGWNEYRTLVDRGLAALARRGSTPSGEVNG